MVRQWQKHSYDGRYYEIDLDDRGPDFIKLADAYNVPAFLATDETSFLDSLEKCLRHNGAGSPALIEAIIDKDEQILPTVTRFTGK